MKRSVMQIISCTGSLSKYWKFYESTASFVASVCTLFIISPWVKVLSAEGVTLKLFSVIRPISPMVVLRPKNC